MTFLSVWNWLKPLQRQPAVCRSRHRRHDRTLRARIVPRLEALEDRTVPSVNHGNASCRLAFRMA